MQDGGSNIIPTFDALSIEQVVARRLIELLKPIADGIVAREGFRISYNDNPITSSQLREYLQSHAFPNHSERLDRTLVSLTRTHTYCEGGSPEIVNRFRS